MIDAIDTASLKRWGSEAEMLRNALADTPINIVPHSAVDGDSMKEAIKNIVRYRGSYIDPRHAVPYLHISCHGRKGELATACRVKTNVLFLDRKAAQEKPWSASRTCI